jgi:hypothetical protein
MQLYSGIDLRASNNFVAVIDANGKRVFKKKIRNEAEIVLSILESFKEEMAGEIPPVESRALPHAIVSEFHLERQLGKIVQSLREDYCEPPRSYRLDWQYPAQGRATHTRLPRAR